MSMFVQNYYAIQNVASGDYTYSCPSYNASNASFPIELDATLITRPGRYVIIKSDSAITNYVGATASFVNGTNGLSIRGVTPSGSSGEVVNYSGSNKYCIVVTVG